MKKIVSSILIVITFGQIFAPFSFSINKEENIKIISSVAEAEDKCIITKDYFSSPFPQSTNDPMPQTVTYNVESTEECIGYIVQSEVLSYGGPQIVLKSPDFPNQRITSKNFSFTLKPGETFCTGRDCNEIRVRVTIKDDQGEIITGKEKSSQSLAYECSDGSCSDDEKWEFISATGTALTSNNDCKFTNVVFTPLTNLPDKRPEVLTLNIGTSGCSGHLLSQSNIHKGVVAVLDIPTHSISNDSFSLEIIPGEQYCSDGDDEENGECKDFEVSLKIINVSSGQPIAFYYSRRPDSADKVSYVCENSNGECDDDLKWSLKTSNNINQTTTGGSTEVYYYDVLNKSGDIIESSQNFTTIETCTEERDEREKLENDQNTNNSVSECKSRSIAITTSDKEIKNIDGLPVCSPLTGKIMGCIAKGIYYLFFTTTSYLFAQVGKILDFTIMYSIDNDSYKSSFVVEGWGIVRDFCNMFFIFILLYIAFGTILGLHSVKTKETIINVILIGLLINFSLFATQVIVDASNILTRVFYNENTISTGTLEGKSIKSQLGDFGEIQLSSAIVNKVDPQKLILEATKVNEIPIRGSTADNDQETVSTTQGKISIGTYILVTLLATAINVIGIIVFLSSSLIFISRVIGLWLAMILAPLAFFSYIVPSMKSFKMIGWSHWWPETLKLAFLAPVFMFFIYLIIKFLDKGLGLVDAATRSGAAKSGMGLVLSIVVPFIFIMILLTKAKDIAKDMSGEMGQKITGAIASAGGIALGGAALGAAALGRSTVGAVAKFTQNDGARQNALKFKGVTDQWSQMNKLNPLSYIKLAGKGISGLGKAAAAAPAAGLAQIGRKTDPHTGKTTNAFQRETAKLADKNHAIHILDEKAKTVTGNKEAVYKDLTEDEQKRVHSSVDRDIASKEQYNKVYDKLDPVQRSALDTQRNPADPRGEWAGAAERNKTIAAGRGEHIHTAEDLAKSSKIDTATSEFVNALRKGSYDLRNISKLQTSSKGMAKFGVGLTALIASGVRMGLRKGVGVEHGTGQKDLFKDLGNVISESLKTVKIEVPKAPSGGGHGEDSHGDGGHH